LATAFPPQQSCLGLGVIFGECEGSDGVEWDIALLLSFVGAAFCASMSRKWYQAHVMRSLTQIKPSARPRGQDHTQASEASSATRAMTYQQKHEWVEIDRQQHITLFPHLRHPHP
jgi:hypothetical protein